MSGITKTPRSCRILCASGVVGPLAPSVTIFALILGAFSIGDLVLERRRNQDVDVESPQLVVGQRIAAGEAVDRLVLLDVREQLRSMSSPFGL